MKVKLVNDSYKLANSKVSKWHSSSDN